MKLKDLYKLKKLLVEFQSEFPFSDTDKSCIVLAGQIVKEYINKYIWKTHGKTRFYVEE